MLERECKICSKRFIVKNHEKCCSEQCRNLNKKIEKKRWRIKNSKVYLRKWYKENKQRVREYNKKKTKKYDNSIIKFNLKEIKRKGTEKTRCQICGKIHYRFKHIDFGEYVSLCYDCFYNHLFHGLELEK